MEEPLRVLFARVAGMRVDKLGLTEPDLVKKGVPAGSAHRGIAPGKPDEPDGQNLQFSTLEKWAAALEAPAWMLIHPKFDGEHELTAYTEDDFEAEVKRRMKVWIESISPTVGGLSAKKPRPDGRSAGKPFGNLKAPKIKSRRRTARKPGATTDESVAAKKK